jgi:hypothetical protein
MIRVYYWYENIYSQVLSLFFEGHYNWGHFFIIDIIHMFRKTYLSKNDCNCL